jgi:hypothetical protein
MKRLSSRTNEKLETPDVAAPPVFDPSRLYTDAELAEKCQFKSVKTVQRWRAKDPTARIVKFNKRTHRTPGHEANRMLQSLLKNSAA